MRPLEPVAQDRQFSHLVARLPTNINKYDYRGVYLGLSRLDRGRFIREMRLHKRSYYAKFTYKWSRATSSCGPPAIICLPPLRQGGHHHAVLLSKLPIGSKPERYRSGRRMRCLDLTYVPKADLNASVTSIAAKSEHKLVLQSAAGSLPDLVQRKVH